MPYLLDSNIVIQAKTLHYSFDFCAALWKWLDLRNNKGTGSRILSASGQ
jgi:hypothetical protein